MAGPMRNEESENITANRTRATAGAFQDRNLRYRRRRSGTESSSPSPPNSRFPVAPVTRTAPATRLMW